MLVLLSEHHFPTFEPMQNLTEAIRKLYQEWKGIEPASLDVLPQSGSERRYFRLYDKDGQSVIGTYGANIKENDTFFYFSGHFGKKNLATPQILAVSDADLAARLDAKRANDAAAVLKKDAALQAELNK